MRKIDAITYELITNPTLLEINFFSSNNMEACEPSFFFFGKIGTSGIQSFDFTAMTVSLYHKLKQLEARSREKAKTEARNKDIIVHTFIRFDWL